MTRSRRAFTFAFTALVFCGCSGTDTGNPFTQPVTADARSSAPEAVSIQTDEGGIVITEAWLSIADPSLFEAQDCSGPALATLPAIGVADHAQSDQLHFEAEIIETSYCKLNLPWTLTSADAGTPSGVVGTSVYLAGTTALGTPFVLRSAFVGEITLSANGNDFELAGDLGGLFLGFDVAAWFSGVDLDTGTQTTGTILIETASNQGLLEAFEANLASGLELYRDVNDNGALDGPEDALLASGE